MAVQKHDGCTARKPRRTVTNGDRRRTARVDVRTSCERLTRIRPMRPIDRETRLRSRPRGRRAGRSLAGASTPVAGSSDHEPGRRTARGRRSLRTAARGGCSRGPDRSARRSAGSRSRRSREYVVEPPRNQAVAQNRLHRRSADPQFVLAAVDGPRDRSSGDLGLVDRWHRLGFFGIRLFDHSNCGVFIAGICTIESWTSQSSWMSSVRTDSVNPWIACFAPQ